MTLRPKKLKWEDKTSYRRGERGKVEPRVWEVQVGRVLFNIHRLIGCEGLWFGSCYALNIADRQLKSTDVEEAKAEWFEWVREYVAAMARSFEDDLELTRECGYPLTTKHDRTNRPCARWVGHDGPHRARRP